LVNGSPQSAATRFVLTRALRSTQTELKETIMDRRTRTEDVLFLMLLAIPAFFAAQRYFQGEAEMNQIALQSRTPPTVVAAVSTPSHAASVSTSIVHRF
jgi:hypothetical protein